MPELVTLTTTLDPEGGGHHQPQVVIYANYLRTLNRAGLTPVLASPAHGTDDVEALIDVSSGLVLSGGEDIEPSRYGEDPIPDLYDLNPVRDAMEWHAVEVALEKGIPILGICRGMQLLNVYFGGTLYQDLPSQYEDSLGQGHYQTAPWGKHHHRVRCTPGSRLHDALADCEPIRINSFHHQAVKDLAPGLECTAKAEDGLVEGVESTEHEWVVGVQWHPERHEAEADQDDPNIRVIDAFADQVRAWEPAPVGS